MVTHIIRCMWHLENTLIPDPLGDDDEALLASLEGNVDANELDEAVFERLASLELRVGRKPGSPWLAPGESITRVCQIVYL